ncbi:hypothetical protein [Streptosporangium sp. NPDC002524]|uniref:hypothetical protein n=1 Tax=Streptosporangium sp. NPDC002524 TaxID=3154537 RepID=UPI00331A1219
MSSPNDPQYDLGPGQLTGAQAARIGTSHALAVGVVDRLLSCISTTDDRRRGPADLTRAVSAARRGINEALQRAITADLLRGATWGEIAAALETGHDGESAYFAFRHLDWAHLADAPQAVWEELHASCPAEVHDVCAHDPRATARQLDAWAARHADPREVVPNPQPVTARL